MPQPIFSNREYAIAIWLCVAAVWLFPKPGVRKSLIALTRSIFCTKLLSFFIGLIVYVFLLIVFFEKLHLWEWPMFKETIFWFLGTAFVMFVNLDEAGRDKHFFKKKALESIGFAVLLEFLINFYTFSLPVELVFIPLVFLLAAMIALVEIDPKYAQAEFAQTKKVLRCVYVSLGIFLFLYAIAMVVRHFQSFATIATLKDLLLSPLLTIALLPYIYILALFIAYSGFFFRISAALKDENAKTVAHLKQKIFLFCHLNLKRLNDLSKALGPHLWFAKNGSDVARAIDLYRIGELPEEPEGL